MNKFKNLLIVFLFVVIFLMLANIVYLDYKILRPGGESLLPEFSMIEQPSSQVPTVSGITRGEVEEIIKEATSSFKLLIGEGQKKTAPPVSSGVKEFFIHLGSGSNNTDDWADITGVEAYIDSTKYGRIKSVVFEAGIQIPTGNEVAYARLFNVTDKHPVWFSEVSLEGGTPKLLTSQPITLDPESKLYRVQMKTSLKFQANLTTARVKISVE